MPWRTPRTAYVHVPFCGHHCGYCDFAVTAGQDHLITLYLEALRDELCGNGRKPVESIFIGGGTPTYLSARQLATLLESLREWLPVGGEFSIESTPDSLDAEKAKLLGEFGVTRVSIGVQSFQPRLLESLDRRHGVEQIPRAVEAVRQYVPQLSFDLIFGAPGQTPAEWDADLSAAIAYEPDHISTYGLTYEKGTPLWKRQSRGEVQAASEDDELTMYEAAMDRLGDAGYAQYEISNFAKPGKRCRHNERYWANEAYFGYGVGAARYVDGKRELNVRDTQTYIRRVLAGESPTFQSEELSPRERALETIAVQLRRAEGVPREAFRTQTGFDLDALVGGAIRELVAIGMLEADVRLTRRGKCVADAVATKLLADAATG